MRIAPYAMPVRSVQRCLEELEQRILELEQEPSTSDSEAVSDGDGDAVRLRTMMMTL